ncbi:hypothetical protein PV327_003765 [Microctonus hyperodae]|uniref:Uncharacterized protein n=1 Tax=Microctonus hyperodae TaxID=165561 RepID=A0AA39G4N6_MICHY|nr:hypothetical protein PV327_003765 [Microctonus hyperodae]
MRAAVLAACLIGFALGGSPRLPRTSADQRSIRNANINNNFTNILPPPVRGSQRSRFSQSHNVVVELNKNVVMKEKQTRKTRTI